LAEYGSIPVRAAVIGWATNVAALMMMFYPIEFKGCFPRLKIGCGLDLTLCGWQGVIPMKAPEMAEVSVDLMTERLIDIQEIFSRLDPVIVAQNVAPLMPGVLTEVLEEAGRESCPKLWEHIPRRVHEQLKNEVIANSERMMISFVKDMQRNILDIMGVKHCAVEALIANPQILNDIFLVCGAEEFDFIRSSGFYLGFFFGVFQMLAWCFCKRWWCLPLCGVFVGYYTNVIALKIIFKPIHPCTCCCGCVKIQGLFLKRQDAVSELYAEQVADSLLTPEVLLKELMTGPKCGKMEKLVHKVVADCMEEQSAQYKPFFLLINGAESWVDLRQGVCRGFWKKLPGLLQTTETYLGDALDLENTLRTKLSALPPEEFERLLHAVFEKDEFKLILVGAVLGAAVGMLQAMVQTPDQLGLPPLSLVINHIRAYASG